LKGKFPDTYENIKTLKGVGPYTTAAISSFAFNLPHAVVDGNVFRVLSRIYGIYTPVDSTEGKKRFTELANKLLDKKQPGLYNQAIMDFGAVICKPAPVCDQCVFNKTCHAFLHNKINELPVKAKKLSIKKRWFYYLVLEHDGKTAIRQRTGKDIWQQLHEFPMIETEKEKNVKTVLSQVEKKGWLVNKKYEVAAISPLYKQQLSHQLITGQFIEIKLKRKPPVKNDWVWLPKNKLKKFAFPRFINFYLNPE
ncbi:MAG TPA: NUDIX domain-containing protein, partial [Ignavibacteriaceae bacterium]